MSIEGLGKKFQEARVARGLSLDEAARLTKIRQSRLAEIEADDYSHFPSLAYAKGFLQIYGKFLHVDVSSFLDAFETSGHITVDGYSYLQDSNPPKPMRTHVARRDGPPRTSIMPLIIGLIVLFAGFWLVRLLLNVQRIGPSQSQSQSVVATPTPAATVATIAAPRAQPVESVPELAAAPRSNSPAAPVQPSTTAVAIAAPTPTLPPPVPTEPEVRRAEPVRPEELAAALASNSSESTGASNRIDIRPLRKTYVQVRVEDDPGRPVFERWISPADGVVQFRGRHVSVRVLDRDAVQIRKNGRIVSNSDADLKIE